jgi:gluconokinase
MTIAIIMGVSGSGKSTVARGLAKHEGWMLLEGDAFHTPANIQKMQAGTPLADEDRWPWLRAIAAREDELLLNGQSAVIACSALKRDYRRILIGDRQGAVLVFLRGTPALIEQRIQLRKGHFMPATLLTSQFEILEEPGFEERPIIVDVGKAPVVIVAEVVRQIRERLP